MSIAGANPQMAVVLYGQRAPISFRADMPRRTSRPAPPRVDATVAREFSRRLRAWFRRHQRNLPWRHTRDPYRILVSELMLQQTQVSRVLEYYPRFLERFPSLHHLAQARPAHVQEAWQGLGYYARARNLHKLAQHVTRDAADARLPEHPHELRALPGIGAYTAGAVASFAYEKRAALVDTNVARVLSRAFAPRLDPKRPRDLARIWTIAERVLPATGKATWVHNQAVMELGALVCTARVMRCDQCPVRACCRTGSRGAAASRKPKAASPRKRSASVHQQRAAKPDVA
jgi:A/G-specific adenine glycosylase